jgi:hypothetical protein
VQVPRLLQHGLDLLVCAALPLLALYVVHRLEIFGFSGRRLELKLLANFRIGMASSEDAQHPIQLFRRILASSAADAFPTSLQEVTRHLSFHHRRADKLGTNHVFAVLRTKPLLDDSLDFFVRLCTIMPDRLNCVECCVADVLA